MSDDDRTDLAAMLSGMREAGCFLPVIAFTAGSVIGAMLAWTATPRLARVFAPLLMIFSSIPYYLLALILLYVFAVWPNWFPRAT